jgi:hypothetical protein
MIASWICSHRELLYDFVDLAELKRTPEEFRTPSLFHVNTSF